MGLDWKNKKIRFWDKKFKCWRKDLAIIFPPDGEAYIADVSGYEDEMLSDQKYWSKNLILQEWTGFLDANNREIYEGDIVDLEIFTRKKNPLIFQIVCFNKFDHGNFFILAGKNMDFDDIPYSDEILKEKTSRNCVVIGNIFQDKKLLK